MDANNYSTGCRAFLAACCTLGLLFSGTQALASDTTEGTKLALATVSSSPRFPSAPAKHRYRVKQRIRHTERRPRTRFVRLTDGPGYRVLRPERAWGTRLLVKRLKEALAEYHLRFPDAPVVWVHDLSQRRGGKLKPHKSHRWGRDVDVRAPTRWLWRKGKRIKVYDVERNWHLLRAILRSEDLMFVFVNYRLQRKLYHYAVSKGYPKAWLSEVFQFPRSKMAHKGIVRHEPGHMHHLHLRYGTKTDPEGIMVAFKH